MSAPTTSGLSFHAGEIFYVVNAADDNWWEAKRINKLDESQNTDFGIIPSKSRVERRERSRQKRVNFNQKSQSRVGGLPLVNDLMKHARCRH
jgi:hypothetical protein